MGDRVIRAGDVELATEAFGDRQHPPLLLIMGAMASMLWWPDEFCRRLAAKGRYVIRYDNRDTGLSTKYSPGQSSYTIEDMAADAMRVLDGYSIARAHLVGMSLGATVGQIAAIAHSERVASLTTISGSPIGTDTSNLPAFSESVTQHMAAAERVDWSDRSQVIAYMIEDARALAGVGREVDEAKARAFVERDYDRAGGYEHALNHGTLDFAESWRGRLREMKAPVLVIHGTADPIYPFEHGAALSQAIKDTRLVRLEGGGHELHPVDWDAIIDAIVSHTSAK